VGQDTGIRSERLEPEPAKEPSLGSFEAAAGHAVGLFVDVDRRSWVLVESPVGPPRRERSSRPPIALVRFVTELDRRQVETDDVLRMPIEQAMQ